MPIIKVKKTGEVRLKNCKMWRDRNPDYEYDHNAYYRKNIEKRREQSRHYKFVKKQFEIYRMILIDCDI
jgi:hypothetical protein